MEYLTKMLGGMNYFTGLVAASENTNFSLKFSKFGVKICVTSKDTDVH